MNKIAATIYQYLPAGIRSIPASLHGYYLRWWRYCAQTNDFVEQAFERERWTPEQWQSWQAERLAYILERAATRVPYYREYWNSRSGRGRTTEWTQLENWPVLEKEPLRQHPRSFLADDSNPRKLCVEHTSGTTGTPLRFWESREMLRAWYALFEARWRRWYGVSRRDRWAILGGQLVVPRKQRRPPFWVWNAAFRQLYLSSYHLAPDLIPHYLNALRSYRITYLLGYTSALHSLAREVLRLGRDDLQMKVVITNAEPVFDYQRETISAAFRCPVRETYGTSEKVVAAGECEAGRLHIWPEVGVIEILQGNEPVAPGVSGDIVVTGLLNTDMPLVRYRIGDRGIMSPPDAGCPCGRSLPVLQSVEGRTDDLLYTPDGRCIGRLDPVFKADWPIHEAQIIQETPERVRIRFVPAPGFGPVYERQIVEQLQARMGEMDVTLEKVSQIPRTASGKFRAVISHVRRSESPQPASS